MRKIFDPMVSNILFKYLYPSICKIFPQPSQIDYPIQQLANLIIFFIIFLVFLLFWGIIQEIITISKIEEGFMIVVAEYLKNVSVALASVLAIRLLLLFLGFSGAFFDFSLKVGLTYVLNHDMGLFYIFCCISSIAYGVIVLLNEIKFPKWIYSCSVGILTSFIVEIFYIDTIEIISFDKNYVLPEYFIIVLLILLIIFNLTTLIGNCFITCRKSRKYAFDRNVSENRKISEINKLLNV